MALVTSELLSSTLTSGMRMLLEELGFPQLGATIIFCDNQSAIHWANGEGKLNAKKHIRLRYHAVEEATAAKEIELRYCQTQTMPADFLTKILSKVPFEMCRDRTMDMKPAGEARVARWSIELCNGVGECQSCRLRP